ncbi:hypothetical protein Hamer_G002562 [Homarus americanus]|uniref:Uncharacterized protein n=1 Tax=Homarus americanus TaxID=6706 RepID=A0A8J5MYY1_HOMAM|nr:hypothetical protein Hamer_G002562 [Homarus americanus]
MQPIDNKTQEWKGATVTKKIKREPMKSRRKKAKSTEGIGIRPTRVKRDNKPQRSLEPEIQEELEGKPAWSEHGATPIAERSLVEEKYRTRTGRKVTALRRLDL